MKIVENKIVVRPHFQEIEYSLVRHFCNNLYGYKNIVFFHSATFQTGLSRYSFITIDPYFTSIARIGYPDNFYTQFEEICQGMERIRFEPIPFLPPFQGGLAGYLSYDLVRNIENLPNSADADIPVPSFAVGLYDLVISMDHLTKRAWIISCGMPELDEQKRIYRARTRLQWVISQLQNQPKPVHNYFKALERKAITSNFTQKSYIKAVERIIEYIINGDIFEANLSQSFDCYLPKEISSFELFKRLLVHNPAPFSSFVNIGDIDVISSSPERFVKIENRVVETRPIKGTIRRSFDPKQDKELAEQLINSEKDHAENTMIVDLMRNDLSKICKPGTVVVEKLCGLESYETVHHLVSVIKGHLQDNVNLIDIINATIPGGSITGAPKIRAMEIIDELEPTRRGAYCGNVFYYGFDDRFDSSILIRSYTRYQEKVRFQAGGAVVLDSDPLQEYEETLLKAKALIQTLTTEEIKEIAL